AGSCSTMQGAEAESPEVAYVVNLPFRARLEADTRGSSFDTLLYLRTACSVGSGDLKCSDDISTDPLAPEVQSSSAADPEVGQHLSRRGPCRRQQLERPCPALAHEALSTQQHQPPVGQVVDQPGHGAEVAQVDSRMPAAEHRRHHRQQADHVEADLHGAGAAA